MPLFGNSFLKNLGLDTVEDTLKHSIDSPVERVGIIDANVLNVRTEPKIKKNTVIGKLSRGMRINILAKTDNGWYHFNYNNQNAFVYGKFVAFEIGQIIANTLNIRKGPSLEDEVIGQVHKYDKVALLLKVPDWWKIEYKGQVAYTYAKYVRPTGKHTGNDSVSDGGSSGGNSGGGSEPVQGDFLKDKSRLLRADVEPRKKIDVPSSPRYERITGRTYNNFGGLLEKLSDEINIDIATAIAVLAIESGGTGFGPAGKVLIRFENHLFHSFWGKYNQKVFERHFRFSTSQRWKNHYFRKNRNDKWESFHGNQYKEWEVMDFARSLNNEKALMSASYGAPQVLGTNHKVLGYASPQDMLDNFSKDIRYHILGLFDFFNPQMIRHLQRKQFTDFARYYNGRGQAYRYGRYIKQAYRAFKKIT